MRKAMNIAALALLLVLAGEAGGERRGAPATSAVNAVMDWRLNWMADSLRFDGCSVYRALGEPADFPAGIRSTFVPHLTATAEPCAAPRVGEERGWPLYVRVDSLRLGETEGRAFVRVFRGEHDHFEEFRVLTRGGPEWYVSEMRMWGAAQSYPAHRPSRSR